jgi:polar amino acid transport system permease protein
MKFETNPKKTYFSTLFQYEAILPWYRRYWAIAGYFVVLFLALALFMPPIGPLTLLQKIIGVLIFLGTLTVASILLADHTKPVWLQAIFPIIIIFQIIGAIYAYSGADFSALGHVFFNQRVMQGQWPLMLEGLLVTLRLAFFAMIFSTLLGLILAVMRAMHNRMLTSIIIAYLNFFRAMPVITILMFVYFALPALNIRLNAESSGILTLALTGGAYTSEIFRAGIESIHHTQVESARALGMTFSQTMRLVILPQAFRIVTPPLTNQWIGTLKDTAICSLIAVTETLKAGMIVTTWKANPTPLLVSAAIFLALILPLTRFVSYLEVRMKTRPS